MFVYVLLSGVFTCHEDRRYVVKKGRTHEDSYLVVTDSTHTYEYHTAPSSYGLHPHILYTRAVSLYHNTQVVYVVLFSKSHGLIQKGKPHPCRKRPRNTSDRQCLVTQDKPPSLCRPVSITLQYRETLLFISAGGSVCGYIAVQQVLQHSRVTNVTPTRHMLVLKNTHIQSSNKRCGQSPTLAPMRNQRVAGTTFAPWLRGNAHNSTRQQQQY